MLYSTISADIISFTAHDNHNRRVIETQVKQLFAELKQNFADSGFYARLVQGDYIECVLKDPGKALRIAMGIKLFIKALDIKFSIKDDERLKYYKEHGVRLSVAIAPLETFDPDNGIVDGEAIYMSGRALKNLSTSDKKKIVIKRTMYFCSTDIREQDKFDAIFALLDTILSKCSAKQSEVIYHKLMGRSEKEIADMLNRNQSTISQHSTAGGWNAIEKTVNYFEKSIKL